MTPVVQAHYGPGVWGSCFSACLASILDLPEAAVPAFYNEDLFARGEEDSGCDSITGCLDGDRPHWWRAAQLWARMMGYRLVCHTEPPEDGPDYIVAVGPNGRMRTATIAYDHAVVWRRTEDGYEFVHDPRPGSPPVVPERFYLFLPIPDRPPYDHPPDPG